MSKRARSPVLGYNHNLRYGGRVFHVQTEDSGQSYARLYTHLFFEGTILSSKKEEYDPAAAEDAVRALMQKLHKAMIRELTRGEHDPRITAFFGARGEPAMLEPRPVAAVAPVATGDASPAVAAAAVPVPATRAPVPPKPPTKPVVIVQPTALKRSPIVVTNPAEGVVVRRNVVIDVGAGQPPVQGTAAAATNAASTRAKSSAPLTAREGSAFVVGSRPRPAAGAADAQPLASARDVRMPWETPAARRAAQVAASAAPVSEQAPTSTSGKIRMPWDPPGKASEGLASDKSLDEVILEYLADDQEPGQQ
jgi:hypothetical protein